MPEPVIVLPAVGPARIAAALHAVVAEDGARAARLRAGATQTVIDQPTDAAAARWFQSLVEAGYLVAAADGFAVAERRAIANLIAQLTGEVVDADALDLNFLDLEAQVAVMGHHERLARVSADLLEQGTTEDAVAFATLVAISDGRLEQAELDVLVELGGHLQLAPDRVRALIDQLAQQVGGRLR